MTSFDSSCWIKTAGYGNVYLPFRSRYNVTHHIVRESSGTAYDATTFASLREQTSHSCPWCELFAVLQTNRIARALHNLAVIHDTVRSLAVDPSAYPVRMPVCDLPCSTAAHAHGLYAH